VFLLAKTDNTQEKLLSARRKRYDRSIMATGVDRPPRSVKQAAAVGRFRNKVNIEKATNKLIPLSKAFSLS
jgi:hypothetical protein